MISPEQLPRITDEHLITRGINAYGRYAYEAENSEIPASFLKTSGLFSLDYFPELLPVDLAEILLEIRFEDDKQAWLALKYADAISAIKSFVTNLEYDNEGPITDKETMNKMYLQIGIAEIYEPNSEMGESVKLTVEDYFKTHPMALHRLEYIEDLLLNEVIH
jgi:hypothetical protein